MLIEIKVKIELSIIRLDILLERLKQALYVVHSESRLAQDAHDFKHWPANLEVMRNDGNVQAVFFSMNNFNVSSLFLISFYVELTRY